MFLTALAVSALLVDVPATPKPADGWRELDRPVMIVNGDMIALSQLVRDLQRHAKSNQITSDAELRSAEAQILGERVRERLGIQAGADMGVDERLIALRVKENMARLAERQNGVVGLSQYLESQSLTGQDAKRLLREEIYGQLWRQAETGEGFGALARKNRDLFVRPGEILFSYREAIRTSSGLRALGGNAGRVKIQQLVLDVEQSGGLEKARTLATTLIQRIRSGEDMGTLVQGYSAYRDAKGNVEAKGIVDVEEAGLREQFPELAAFTDHARIGDVSAPLFTVRRGLELLIVLQFLERIPGKTPGLSDPLVQEKIEKQRRKELEERRLETGFLRLLRASYVWPPEFAAQ